MPVAGIGTFKVLAGFIALAGLIPLVLSSSPRFVAIRATWCIRGRSFLDPTVAIPKLLGLPAFKFRSDGAISINELLRHRGRNLVKLISISIIVIFRYII
ncbi:hypothetical protein V1524DRAFT_441191 [Lipomyces starkeyi]